MTCQSQASLSPALWRQRQVDLYEVKARANMIYVVSFRSVLKVSASKRGFGNPTPTLRNTVGGWFEPVQEFKIKCN